MIIILRRIKKQSFDDLLDKVISNYKETGKIELDDEILEKNSEDVMVNGKQVQVSYDLDKYLTIVNNKEEKYKQQAKIGMLLHKDTRDTSGNQIPKNMLYEKELWAYLSFKLFSEVIVKLRFEDAEKMNEDKITRFFFNVKTRSRTGLLFLWSMIDSLGSEDDENTSIVAFHFIDPVKAIYERTMSRNPMVLRAFVQSIINLHCDGRIKNQKYKVKVPNNISCFARINYLDAYELNEMTEIITSQIQEVLNMA